MNKDEIIEGVKSICAPLPESRALCARIVAELESRLDDYVYVIHFDQDEFGIFPTREQAEASLKEQIAGHGPAWEDCEITPRRIYGGD